MKQKVGSRSRARAVMRATPRRSGDDDGRRRGGGRLAARARARPPAPSAVPAAGRGGSGVGPAPPDHVHPVPVLHVCARHTREEGEGGCAARGDGASSPSSPLRRRPKKRTRRRELSLSPFLLRRVSPPSHFFTRARPRQQTRSHEFQIHEVGGDGTRKREGERGEREAPHSPFFVCFSPNKRPRSMNALLDAIDGARKRGRPPSEVSQEPDPYAGSGCPAPVTPALPFGFPKRKRSPLSPRRQEPRRPLGRSSIVVGVRAIAIAGPGGARARPQDGRGRRWRRRRRDRSSERGSRAPLFVTGRSQKKLTCQKTPTPPQKHQ
jgi:hypothetical protein